MKKNTKMAETNRWGMTAEECSNLGRCPCGCWAEVTVKDKGGRCLSCAEVSDAVINGGTITALVPLTNSFTNAVYPVGGTVPNEEMTSIFRYNGV